MILKGEKSVNETIQTGIRRKQKMKRAGGILLPITSLPSKYVIGAFSKEAYEFVDKLAEAGQSYWQILPLGPTSYGDSPYLSFSTFAGNPYFIDLEAMIEEGVLTKEECDACDFGDDPHPDNTSAAAASVIKVFFIISSISVRLRRSDTNIQ